VGTGSRRDLRCLVQHELRSLPGIHGRRLPELLGRHHEPRNLMNFARQHRVPPRGRPNAIWRLTILRPPDWCGSPLRAADRLGGPARSPTSGAGISIDECIGDGWRRTWAGSTRALLPPSRRAELAATVWQSRLPSASHPAIARASRSRVGRLRGRQIGGRRCGRSGRALTKTAGCGADSVCAGDRADRLLRLRPIVGHGHLPAAVSRGQDDRPVGDVRITTRPHAFQHGPHDEQGRRASRAPGSS
jgi:hypothetical protein